MAATGTPTPNIGLRIPLGTDPASVDDINYNSTLIDTKLGAVGNDSVQDQLNDLNSNITNVTTGIITKTTKASSGTLDFTTCRKQGKIVNVSGRVYNLPGTTTAVGAFFSIPEGFRPSVTVYVSGYMNITGVGSVPILAEITTGGDVNLGYSSSNYVSQVGFSGCYAIP